MALNFVRIHCSEDALAVVLYVLKGHLYIQISDVGTQVHYIGFVNRLDALLLQNFAKRNGYQWHSESEESVRSLRFHKESVKIIGDKTLAPWLLV